MFRSYWNTGSYGHSYSRNGYSNRSYSSPYSMTSYYSYYRPYAANTYYYGGSRRQPHAWDRDNDRRRNRRGRWNRRPRQQDRGDEELPKVDEEEVAKTLKVTGIDLHVEKNTVKHRTDKFRCTDDGEELVLRRGDSFLMTLKFDRPFNKKKYDCRLGFSIGENPNLVNGTQVNVEVDETGKEIFSHDQWGANLRDKHECDITVEVHIPANCRIGEWNISVTTFFVFDDKEKERKPADLVYSNGEDFTVLFNPWCKDDTVYMPKEKLLDEYILNPTGCVYRGNRRSLFGKPWVFGQFQKGILECALFLMREGFTTDNNKALSNPVKVSRMVAKMVNSSDDNGVLSGNWSGDYRGGIPPTKWAGSSPILRQYMETGEPVKFGQCWVFSCVTTTVCRALGIPCRTVTNFASAHDNDMSCTIDEIWEKNDEDIYEKSPESDSTWNFHVWNEVWMTRPDLGADKRYDGWQVIDATPQETSNGFYQCGPCPVSAVKRGLVNVGYDTPFVFAEVNADKITWLKKHGQLERGRKQTHSIGHKISTKKPDGKRYSFLNLTAQEKVDLSNSMRLDITQEYKFTEGSTEERASVKKAYELSDHKRPGAYGDPEEIHPIEFKLMHKSELFVGEELALQLEAFNHSKLGRTTNVIFTVAPQTYDGQVGKHFFKKKFGEVSIGANCGERFSANLTQVDYQDFIIEQGHIKVEACIEVPKCEDEKEFIKIKSHEIRFTVPDLDIQAPGQAKKGEPVKFVVSFTNPMSKTLTQCDISMSGEGFKDFADQKVDDIPAECKFEKVFELAPNKKGENTVNFTFDSKELKDISGSATIDVSP